MQAFRSDSASLEELRLRRIEDGATETLFYLKRSALKGPKGRSSSDASGVTLLQLLHCNSGSHDCLPQRNAPIIGGNPLVSEYRKITGCQLMDHAV